MEVFIEAIAASVLMHAVFFGLVHTFALVLLFHGIGMERIAGYDLYVDVGATLFFTFLYAGTYSGTTVGIFAGLFMSVYLKWFRYWRGYSKWSLKHGWLYYHNNRRYDDWNVGYRQENGTWTPT